MQQDLIDFTQAIETCNDALGNGGGLRRALGALEELPEGETRAFLEALVRLKFDDEVGADALLKADCAQDRPLALWLSATMKMRKGDIDDGRLLMNRAWKNRLPKSLMLESYAALFKTILSPPAATLLSVEAARSSGDPLDYLEKLIEVGYYDEAQRALDSLSCEDVASPHGLLIRIRILMLTGHLDEAEALLNTQRDVLNDVRYQLAVDALKNQFELNKLEYQDVLARTDPSKDERLVFLFGEQRVRALMLAGQLDEAVSLARELWSDPLAGNHENLTMARALIREGLFDVARECLLDAGEPNAEPPTEHWMHWQLLMARVEAATQGGQAARPRLEKLRQVCSLLCIGGEANLSCYLLWMHCLRELGRTEQADEIYAFVKLRYADALPEGVDLK